MRRFPLYTAVFLVGFAVMGFEMIASRLIVPWFGGGIDTWAALISTVLSGLAVGYFAGGALPPRWKTPNRVAALLLAAAFYMALVPLLEEGLLRALSDHMGETVTALLLGTMLVCFVPVTLLGMFAPCSVDLMAGLTARYGAGEIAGQLYGISTLGSVCGTLGTAFFLIPSAGTLRIILVLAAMTFAAGALLWVPSTKRQGLRMFAIAAGSLLWFSLTACMEKPAPPPPPPPPPIASRIFNAKKVFVSNLGSDPVAAVNLPGGADGCYNTFYTSLRQWGHYQLVSSPESADLVFEISATKREETDGMGRGPRSPLHDYVKYPAIITLLARDTSTGSTLWATKVGFLSTANTRKTELKQFDQAIEGLTNRLKAMAGGAVATPTP